jgi:hypothetical protein
MVLRAMKTPIGHIRMQPEGRNAQLEPYYNVLALDISQSGIQEGVCPINEDWICLGFERKGETVCVNESKEGLELESHQ